MKKFLLLNALGVCLLIPSARATSVFYDFTVPDGTLNANSLPVSGTVRFTITDSDCFSGSGTCLLVDILNDQASISKVNQSISDLSFHLFNSGTEVLSNGLLYSQWYSTLAQDPVQEDSGSGPANAPDNLVDRWHLDTFDATLGMHLDAIGGGQPDHLIGFPSSQGQFNPYLTGHVIFEINGIAGLSLANSTISGVKFSYGTTGGEFVTDGCPVGEDCGGGGPQELVPEPYSLSLVGGGLLAIGLFRRRKSGQ